MVTGVVTSYNKTSPGSNVPDQGEALVVVTCMIAILGVSWFLGHENISKKALAEKGLGEQKGKVVGNFPLRKPNQDNAGVFDKTSKQQMSEREKAMKHFVRTVYNMHKQKAIDAKFSTETGEKANWWNRLYRLESLFGEDDGRYLPVSFALRATDRANNSEFTLSGGVSKIVVESEKDFLDPKTSQTAFKVTMTLHDSNWANGDDNMAPGRVEYIFSQTEKGFGTSIVKGGDGKPLPIFVNFMGLRLEREPVVYSDQVWQRFMIEGLGMEVNRRQPRGSLASVRLHENKGSNMFFFLEAISMLDKDSLEFKKGTLDERDNTYVHKLETSGNRGVLPLVVHIADQVVPVKSITISGAQENMELKEPNMIYDVWIRLVTNQVLQLTGPKATRDWKIADPAVSEEEKKKLVKFVASDPIDLVLLDNTNSVMSIDVPEHGVEFYKVFKMKSYRHGISYNVDWYNAAQLIVPERPVYDLSIAPPESVDWKRFGEYELYAQLWPAVVILAILAGSVWDISGLIGRNSRWIGMFLETVGVVCTLLLVYVVYSGKKELGVIANYTVPICAIVITVGVILALMGNSCFGMIPMRIVITFVMSFVAFCVYYLVFNGWYEYTEGNGGVEEEMRSDFMFIIVIASSIAMSLGVGQLGIYFHHNRCAYSKIPITPITSLGVSWQTILQVLMAGAVLKIMYSMTPPKDHSEELEYAEKMRDGADDENTKRYFTEEVAIIKNKYKDGPELAVPATIGFVMLLILSLWVYRQTTGDMHTPHASQGEIPEGENRFFFMAKYAILVSVLYTVVTRMTTELFVLEDDDVCTAQRKAMYGTLVKSEEKQFSRFDQLREFVAIEMAKYGCVTQSSKPVIVAILILLILIPLVSLTGSMLHTPSNNLLYTFFVATIISAAGSGTIWVLDKNKRDNIVTFNPVFLGNTLLL